MWAKQRREEVLLDVEDVSAGHQTVMRWNGEELWVWSAEPAHEATIPRGTFDANQARMAARSGGRGPRTAPKRSRHYVLRSRLSCALCQRNLQGAVSNGRTWYRWKFGVEYAAAALQHPNSVNPRADQLLPRVDEWPATIFGEEHLDDTCEALASAAELEAVVDTSVDEATLRGCDTKLARYRAASTPAPMSPSSPAGSSRSPPIATRPQPASLPPGSRPRLL